MAVISRDLGPVTAYAAAVNRGYTGTREEFEALMASYATVAQEAGESASAAADSASDAESSASAAATSASDASSFASEANTSAGNASNAATAAGIAQTAAESARNAAQSAQTAAEAAQEGAETAVEGFDSTVTQAISDVNAAGTNQKELAKRQAEKSEAWAVGKINGEDVGVSDPAYHNNAKYYAESAGTSATTATTKASEAAQSASGAAESANAAAESARTLTIDRTLTQTGQAADAKATGKEINAVREIINSEFYTSTTQESGQFVKINGIGQKCKINSEDDDLILTHIGKNILPFPYFRSGSVTSNGITFTINDDGSIRVYGTATSSVTYQITQETPASSRQPIKKGTYTFSGTPKTGFTGTPRMFLSGIGQGSLYEYGDGKSFTVAEDTTYYLKINIPEGTEIDAVFYPQIEFGGKKTKWERYKKETITLVDGNAETTLFDGINAFLASSDFSLEYNIPETINLKLIGAVGDGIADDTFAINKALKMAEGKTLFIPEGTYLFSETLEIHSDTHIVGCGAKSKFLLADSFTLTPYAWRTGDPLVEDPHRYPMICFDEDAQGCVLENFALQGQSATFYDKNCDGLTVRGSNHSVKNLHVTKINYFPSNFIGRVNNGVGYGLKVQSATNVIIEHCYVEECGYECVGLEDASDVTITGCVFKKACQTAGQIHRDCTHIRVCNNTFDNTNHRNSGTSGPGFTVHASIEHPMWDILIDGNYITSAFVFANGGAENRIRIVNNQMGGISLNAIEGYREGCIVVGNRIGGQLNIRCDNVVVGGNMVYHTGGGYMIRIYGNNVETFANVALGDASGVLIQPHDN